MNIGTIKLRDVEDTLKDLKCRARGTLMEIEVDELRGLHDDVYALCSDGVVTEESEVCIEDLERKVRLLQSKIELSLLEGVK